MYTCCLNAPTFAVPSTYLCDLRARWGRWLGSCFYRKARWGVVVAVWCLNWRDPSASVAVAVATRQRALKRNVAGAILSPIRDGRPVENNVMMTQSGVSVSPHPPPPLARPDLRYSPSPAPSHFPASPPLRRARCVCQATVRPVGWNNTPRPHPLPATRPSESLASFCTFSSDLLRLPLGRGSIPSSPLPHSV